MRIGIVCPYAWQVPGGVQFHIRDLAVVLRSRGHEVQIVAPGEDTEQSNPEYVTLVGKSIPITYNGSVARVSLGPVAHARLRSWFASHEFDVVHVHEPAVPSLSLSSLKISQAPVVGTFHTSNIRSRLMNLSFPILYPALERIAARIAVSEAARRTLIEHLGGDAILIPNGVDTKFFAAGTVKPEWSEQTLGFIGRINEERKGLTTLLDALELLLPQFPHLSVLIAGTGDLEAALSGRSEQVRAACTYLGRVSESEKANLLRSVTAYVAPNLGGESFGIILVEAMAAGAPVIASNLDAFYQVLDQGNAGFLFETGNAADLARLASQVLQDTQLRAQKTAYASQYVAKFDWDTVTDQIESVYQTVASGQHVSSAKPYLAAAREFAQQRQEPPDAQN